jgi:hypothetical protein
MMMMKRLIPAVFVALAFAVAATIPVSAQQQEKKVSLQSVFNKAEADFKAGKYAEAKAGYEAVLKARPDFVYARQGLAKTEAAIKNPPKQNSTVEASLAALIVPKFKFEDASFGTVLEYLTEKSTELSGGKVTANFIYKGPAADRDNKLITLSLANVPLTEVIRYVGAQAGVRFTYDKYAVVGTPLAEAQKAEAAAETAKEEASLKEATRKSFLEEREEKERQAVRNPFQ